ncbi:MAG: deoxyribodipyrimidine photo-lyase [Rhodanobacteraceae bacterium]
MSDRKAIVWFRDDLRLDDNPALRAAIEQGYLPIPVYVHAPGEEGEWAPGAASNAWRHRSLGALSSALEQRGSRLHFAIGNSLDTLRQLARSCSAETVFWNRRYEPAVRERDAAIKQALTEGGLDPHSFNAALLFEPWEISTQQDTPYKVFTPFWKAARAAGIDTRLWQAPERLGPGRNKMPLDGGVPLDALGLNPSLPWDKGFWQRFTPGEIGARQALDDFVDDALSGYSKRRDHPPVRGTSRMSPHLHFGEISPRRVVAAVESCADRSHADIDKYIAEIGWREFSCHLLYHFPDTATHNLNPRFANFEWKDPGADMLRAWQQGRTGVPIIDAGMRELWHTGWMHNRVRMLVASYLTKHMRAHWLHGARWFWDTLVDADLASNTQGWQWTAGTGADAAPYFRIFNPVLQARRFDPEGDYIARWVPELADLSRAARMEPWQHAEELSQHDCDYPARPLVDLSEGRERALAAYKKTS